MDIGFIGTGTVADAIASQLCKNHNISFGTYNLNSLKAMELMKKYKNSTLSNVKTLIKDSEILFYCAPFSSAEAILEGTNFKKKILIDCSNPLQFGANGLEGLQIGHTSSAAEFIDEHAGNCKVVKAFNTVSASIMANPSVNGKKPDVYVCSDHPKAIKKVNKLINEMKMNPINCGELKMARYLEPMGALWTSMAINGMGSRFISNLIIDKKK